MAFAPPALLCLAIGGAFAASVLLFQMPAAYRLEFPRVALSNIVATPGSERFASGDPMLAMIGGFRAYQGHAAVTLVIALAVIATALGTLLLFVKGWRTRIPLFLMLAPQIGLALWVNLWLGSGMSAAVRDMRCPPHAPAPPWDVCSLDKVMQDWPHFHYGLNAIIDATCVAATACVVCAIFIVASVRRPPRLPAIIGSTARCVTILLAAASALLVSVVLIDKSFLHWAFADFLALAHPPGDVASYISGISVFNAALTTALLGVTWFISLVLMTRNGHDPSGSDIGPGSFSAYNLSAIFAPALSAIAANLLTGQ
jgi:hypothetical protein